MNENKFSCHLTAILARNKEVIAVRLEILPNGCRVYLSINFDWIEKEETYIKKVEEYAPEKSMDVNKDLFDDLMTYCNSKLNSRLRKLKKDIFEGQHFEYIKSFMDFASLLRGLTTFSCST